MSCTLHNQHPQLLPQGDRLPGHLTRIFIQIVTPEIHFLCHKQIRKSRGSLWDFCTGKSWGVGELGLPRSRFGGMGFLRDFWDVFSKVFLPFPSPVYSWLCVCQRQIPGSHQQLFLQKLLLGLSCRSEMRKNCFSSEEHEDLCQLGSIRSPAHSEAGMKSEEQMKG